MVGLLEASHAALFAAELRRADTSERRRGRTDERRIDVLVSCDVDLPRYLGFSGAAQAFRVTRWTKHHKSGAVREQSVVGITSLPAPAATPAALLSLVRGHWRIENRSHWVRDVTLGEDKSQVRTGNLPQVMAALRNAAISLARLAGHRNIAAALRRYAARPGEAIALLGRQRTE